MQMLAIDLAKQLFHVHGMSEDGEVVSRRVGSKGWRRRSRSSLQGDRH